MSGSISLNPALVTNAAGLFSVSTNGYTQGSTLNDAAVRNELVSGIVSPSAANPFWGGMAITDSLWTAGVQSSEIGSVLALATAAANVTGFTVFEQSSAGYITPQSNVPLYPANTALNFYRLGSGARIPVQCSSTVAAALAAGASNIALYWDYTNQVLLSAPGGTALPVKLVGLDTGGNSKVVAYNATGSNIVVNGVTIIPGAAMWNNAGFVAVIQI
jgi:hypothetical protein